MRVRVEAADHDVVAARAGPRPSAATAVLLAEDIERRPLDETIPRDRHHHLPRLDQALIVLVRHAVDDLRQAWRRDLVPHRHQLLAHNLEPADPAVQHLQQRPDFGRDLRQIGLDLLLFEPCEARQAQLQNTAGLRLRQADGAVDDGVAHVIDQAEQHADVSRRPGGGHQRGAGAGGIWTCADHADDLVDIGHRDRQTHQDMRPVPRLVQIEPATAEDHLFPERNKQLQRILQPQQPRAPGVERQHVDWEVRL